MKFSVIFDFVEDHNSLCSRKSFILNSFGFAPLNWSLILPAAAEIDEFFIIIPFAAFLTFHERKSNFTAFIVFCREVRY